MKFFPCPSDLRLLHPAAAAILFGEDEAMNTEDTATPLREVFEHLYSYVDELTIYVSEYLHWSASSPALVEVEPSDGSLPKNAAKEGMQNFL
jgi:hypothetical protein